jgi:hypothetical protein
MKRSAEIGSKGHCRTHAAFVTAHVATDCWRRSSNEAGARRRLSQQRKRPTGCSSHLLTRSFSWAQRGAADRDPSNLRY